MFTSQQTQTPDRVYISALSAQSGGLLYRSMGGGVPASNAMVANRIIYVPFFVRRPYAIERYFWQNGATVGTDNVQVGIYDADFNLLNAGARAVTSGSNAIQYTEPGVHFQLITNNGSSTDATSYATASGTWRKGVTYLVCVENSHGTSANAVSTISGGPTFASRATTQYNGTLNRTSIWSAQGDGSTGALTIDFGGGNTQTGCVWSVIACYGVDQATNDGVVQGVTGTGTSTTPLATLAALGSANNGVLGAHGQAANATFTPGTGLFELSDSGTATPAQALEVECGTNDTTVDATITSAAWGSCAVEMKTASSFILPRMRGWIAVWSSGATTTMFRGGTASTSFEPGMYIQGSATTGLVVTGTPTSGGGQHYIAGFTRRASP
jgi:hypothetical protein